MNLNLANLAVLLAVIFVAVLAAHLVALKLVNDQVQASASNSTLGRLLGL